jgi:hypothetical protein
MVIEDERGYRQYGQTLSFTTVNEAQTQSFSGRPVAETEGVKAITNASAELSSFISMNDYDNGYVFVVYGTNLSILNDIEDYETYAEIPKLKGTIKSKVKEGFAGRDRLSLKINKLKSATRYYYRSCVQYGKTGNRVFKCGDVETFMTLN